MYTLSVKRDLIAQHYLVGGDWGAENDPHSHHYVIDVRLEAAGLDRHGYLVDIVRVEAELAKVVDYFGDRMLNELPEFEGLNPSLEHFSRIVCERLLAGIAPPGSGRFSVRIWENEACWAAYTTDY